MREGMLPFSVVLLEQPFTLTTRIASMVDTEQSSKLFLRRRLETLAVDTA